MSERIRPRHPIRQQVGSMVWEAIADIFGFKVSQESLENTSQINDHLLESAAVPYVNHQEMGDTPLATAYLLAHLPNAGDMMGPAGMKHFDFKRDPFSAAVFRMLPPIGIRPMPVVQEGDGHNYSENSRKRMLEKLKVETGVAIVSPGGIYGIAPEGTRSHDGTLQSSKRGLGYLPGYDPEGRLLYVPVGIIYKNELLGTDQNEIRVGKPFKFSDLGLDERQVPDDRKERAQLIADTMMYRLEVISKPFVGK